MKVLMGFLVCCVLLLCPAYMVADTSKVIDAACRIEVVGEGSVGTGCVFNVTTAVVQVLTAAHVVDAKIGTAVDCTFYYRGYPSGAIRGKVVWAARGEGKSTRDVAVVEIPRQSFGDIIPPVIPLAPDTRVIQRNETIQSCGCPKGSWPNAFKGHVLNVDESAIKICPRPAQGRSGSALVNEDGTEILGVIIWQSTDQEEPCGYAVSIQEIWRAMRGQPTRGTNIINTRVVSLGDGLELVAWAPEQTQCGPQGCFPRGDQQGPFQRFRQQQQQQKETPSQPWAGLPETYKPESAPPLPAVPDLSEQVNSNTSRIGSLEKTAEDHQTRIANLEQDETPGVWIIVLSAIGVGIVAIVASVCVYYGLFSN